MSTRAKKAVPASKKGHPGKALVRATCDTCSIFKGFCVTK